MFEAEKCTKSAQTFYDDGELLQCCRRNSLRTGICSGTVALVDPQTALGAWLGSPGFDLTGVNEVQVF